MWSGSKIMPWAAMSPSSSLPCADRPMALHIGVGAAGGAEVLAAVQRPGHLHTEYDGEPALVDDAAGLERVGHDAEESPTRAACLGVDVALELEGAQRLPAHRGHLVARVL